MANKRERQAVIRELIQARPVSSQEDLRRLLLSRGWAVTQSTLSRDMHELGIARIPSAEGVRYVFPGNGGEDEGPNTLDSLLPALFLSVDGVRELAVLKTVTGGAQPVAVALDAEETPDVLGTLAGDDTILIICRSEQARTRLSRRLERLGIASPAAGD